MHDHSTLEISFLPFRDLGGCFDLLSNRLCIGADSAPAMGLKVTLPEPISPGPSTVSSYVSDQIRLKIAVHVSNNFKKPQRKPPKSRG
ncbi:hypothetical protein B0H19DRAFT_62028 [Mycena capillaripes]|nr:hypothetical protein B0H19DRAFT_62028 [Mycena capillaripes]